MLRQWLRSGPKRSRGRPGLGQSPTPTATTAPLPSTATCSSLSAAGVVGLLLPHSRNARVARGDEAELARLATWRATRRSGVARTLMSHCEKTAREDGRIALVLWTRPRQRAAHVLYESLGFERIPDRDFLDSGEPCRAYCLALVPAVHR